MEIRILMAHEIRRAVEVATEVYTERVLPFAETPEEIDCFREYVDEDRLWRKQSRNELSLWGVFVDDGTSGNALCAVGALEKDGRITMLYVRTAYMYGGYEAELEREMRRYAQEKLGLSQQSVWVELMHPRYEQSGHAVWGERSGSVTWNGKDGNGAGSGRKQRGKLSGKIFLMGFAVMFLMVVLFQFVAIKSMRRMTERFIVESESEPDVPIAMEIPHGTIQEEQSEADERELSVNEHEYLTDGLGTAILIPWESIYVAEDIEYTVTEACIEVPMQDEEVYVEFEINYPQINYTDGRDAGRINQILRDGAAVWFDTMYPKPDMNVIVFDEEYPYLASYVDYQITYMSNDLLCVAYEDHYFTGSVYAEFGDLRTRIINLRTGELYGIPQVLSHDEDLDALYYHRICEEEDGFIGAESFDKELAGVTLDGDIADGRFFSNLIISRDGVSINLTYHYGDENLIMRGWVSIPFSDEELEEYRTDGEFWDLYKI